ncbi:MAG: hypothetical protein EPO42_14400 [Gallionellaceae bacterium]|nr:MAG: hypothetical protein EPO42_14400 [Gallionellaceae bacterium]
MALGALTIVEKVEAVGPAFTYRCTIVGDGAYSAGGSTGLLAKLRVATGKENLNIIGVQGQSAPATVSELEYDHTNEKLFARVRATGVESAVADQSAVTYGLVIDAA